MEMEIKLIMPTILGLMTFSFLMVIKLTNPLALCLNLVLISFTVAMVQMISLSKWLAASTVLIFLGGMMVVFFYATSLSNNDKFFSSMNWTFSLAAIIFVFVMWTKGSSQMLESMMPISSVYADSSQMFIFIMVAYLLMVLVYVVKMASNFKGAFMKSF